LKIARMAVRGIEVFGDKEKLIGWLQRSNVALGRRKPMDLLASGLGIDLVLDELGRIEHGLAA
jgi:putative toxin-antitoxin system antitoxin component (TIGR02293 family)